jgi:hypothetical protein
MDKLSRRSVGSSHFGIKIDLDTILYSSVVVHVLVIFNFTASATSGYRGVITSNREVQIMNTLNMLIPNLANETALSDTPLPSVRQLPRPVPTEVADCGRIRVGAGFRLPIAR